MRRPLVWILIASLCACAAPRGRSILDDDDPLAQDGAQAERDLAEIEHRVAAGDLPPIQFDNDSDRVTSESHATLVQIAEMLAQHPRVKLMIIAHTDSVGTEAYNLDLSERRAKSVKKELVKRGAPPPSIRFRGMGPARPIASNTTPEGRMKNRRVEFRLTHREWDAVY